MLAPNISIYKDARDLSPVTKSFKKKEDENNHEK